MSGPFEEFLLNFLLDPAAGAIFFSGLRCCHQAFSVNSSFLSLHVLFSVYLKTVKKNTEA